MIEPMHDETLADCRRFADEQGLIGNFGISERMDDLLREIDRARAECAELREELRIAQGCQNCGSADLAEGSDYCGSYCQRIAETAIARAAARMENQ